MARHYRLTLFRRVANRLVSGALKLGVGPRRSRLLTVRGRKSGQPYTTPVNLVERSGRQYLVAPYGEVSWVKNARAAGEMSLRRGRHAETRRIEELAPGDALDVLRDYHRQNGITRPYFGPMPADDPEASEREAARHPVFLLL